MYGARVPLCMCMCGCPFALGSVRFGACLCASPVRIVFSSIVNSKFKKMLFSLIRVTATGVAKCLFFSAFCSGRVLRHQMRYVMVIVAVKIATSNLAK